MSERSELYDEETSLCRWCGVRLMSFRTTWHWIHEGGYLHCMDESGATIFPHVKAEPTRWREVKPKMDVCLHCGESVSQSPTITGAWLHTKDGRYFCKGLDGESGAKIKMKIATPPVWVDAQEEEWWM